MKVIKLILVYILWAILICLSSLGLVRLWMGPKKVSATFLEQLMAWGYGLTLMVDSVVIASISLIIFIFLDLFYIKKRVTLTKPIVVKLILVLILTTIVAVSYLGLDYYFKINNM
ncbi:hypothetical protein M4I21_15840 [Cellulophaga sp. 20_2_10]|uniref:hypothetical protein n=1 Tax=Cellulophaga sp. 20_2_10 TaxID=2942476 RepID=UPI00201AD182|nr:hypothetical protein [Cellulophaga sp. 20_2_10]MCL5247294.1 hypothetical protein [Cellulophaga sp. 20_2_10]